MVQVEDTSDQFLKTTLVSKAFPVTGLVSCSDSQRSIASLPDTEQVEKRSRTNKRRRENTLLSEQTLRPRSRPPYCYERSESLGYTAAENNRA